MSSVNNKSNSRMHTTNLEWRLREVAKLSERRKKVLASLAEVERKLLSVTGGELVEKRHQRRRITAPDGFKTFVDAVYAAIVNGPGRDVAFSTDDARIALYNLYAKKADNLTVTGAMINLLRHAKVRRVSRGRYQLV